MRWEMKGPDPSPSFRRRTCLFSVKVASFSGNLQRQISAMVEHVKDKVSDPEDLPGPVPPVAIAMVSATHYNLPSLKEQLPVLVTVIHRVGHQCEGHVFKSTPGALLLVFPTAAQAMKFAIALQEELLKVCARGLWLGRPCLGKWPKGSAGGEGASCMCNTIPSLSCAPAWRTRGGGLACRRYT